MKKPFGIGLTLMLLATGVQGAPLVYDESISGDIASNGPYNGPSSEPLLTFDLGVNTVSGSVSHRGIMGTPSESKDADRFIFTVPDGYYLTSVKLEVLPNTRVGGDSIPLLSLYFFGFDFPSTPIYGSGLFDLLPGYTLPLAVPGAVFSIYQGGGLPGRSYGTYLAVGSGGYPGITVFDEDVGYRMSYEISASSLPPPPVPLPAALPLFLSGLCGVFGLRVRRRT